MSSLGKAIVTIHFILKNKKPSLKNKYSKICLAQGKIRQFLKRILLLTFQIKLFLKCYRRWKLQKIKGSMTVEAAIILPLVLFFFLNISSVIEMLCLHGKLQMGLWEVGSRMSVYSYIHNQIFNEEIGETEKIKLKKADGIAGVVLSYFYVKSELIDYVGEEYLNNSPLTQGTNGLNFLESSILTEDDGIDLKLTYQVSSEIPILGFPLFRMANRYYSRAWTGYEVSEKGQQEQKEYVYITETGKVYHISRNCSYLKMDIKEILLEKACISTNQKGEIYTMCKRCYKEKSNKTVYITLEGQRYHYSQACPNLRRHISIITKDNAKEYQPCSRCAGG